MRLFVLLIFFFISGIAVGQNRQPKPIVKDSLSSDVFLDLVEKTLSDYYREANQLSDYNLILDDLETEITDDITDEEICKRLKSINEISSYKLDCNRITIDAIRTFIRTRKSFVQITMSRASIYFGMYDEVLDQFNMPPIIKYLSVIESAMNPKIRSRAGALGLWQFMYGTGKLMGLQSNSYLDERMDPYKSTVAACQYLSKMYAIYGDWNMALAAYNGGPGTVNRAIRRSGGKMNYWQIRQFLPKETQQYVPRFIAATYLFVFANQHQVKKTPVVNNYYQLDTMCLKKGVYMKDIANLVNWSVDSIQFFNPVYKGTYIPKTEPQQCITGPLKYIGKIVSMEEQLYSTSGSDEEEIIQDQSSNPDELYPLKTETIYEDYEVKKGEDVMDVAQKFNTSPTFIKEVNQLTSNSLKEGSTIKIPKKVVSSVQSEGSSNFEIDTIYYDTIITVHHIVDRNENLESIAQKYKVDKDSILQWNELGSEWINIGQELLIHGNFTKYNLVKKEVTTPRPTPKPVPTTQFYIVRQGDLFNRIATRYGLSMEQLRRLNPGVNPNQIRVGQKLRVK